MKKAIYIIVVLLVVLVFGRQLRPLENEQGFDITSFSELPVQAGGRIKPLDSVARNTLLILSGRQKVETPDGKWLQPIEWFMDLTMRPEIADTYRIFKIEFPDDLGLAGLAQQGQRYYSFNDLRPHFDEILSLYNKIDPEIQRRSAYDRQIADLNDGLMLYHRVMHSLHPIGGPDRLDRLVDEYRSFRSSIGPGLEELRKQQAGEEYDATVLNRFIAYGDDYLKLSQTAHLRVVPPPPPIDPMQDWLNIGEELLTVMQGNDLSPYVTSYAGLTMAYRTGDTDTFNKTAQELRLKFVTDFPDDIKRVHFERVFNGMQPFALSMRLYILIFLFVCISWLRWGKELSLCAFWILVFAFLIQTFGLLSRMYIQELDSFSSQLSVHLRINRCFRRMGSSFTGCLHRAFFPQWNWRSYGIPHWVLYTHRRTSSRDEWRYTRVDASSARFKFLARNSRHGNHLRIFGDVPCGCPGNPVCSLRHR